MIESGFLIIFSLSKYPEMSDQLVNKILAEKKIEKLKKMRSLSNSEIFYNNQFEFSFFSIFFFLSPNTIQTNYFSYNFVLVVAVVVFMAFINVFESYGICTSSLAEWRLFFMFVYSIICCCFCVFFLIKTLTTKYRVFQYHTQVAF